MPKRCKFDRTKKCGYSDEYCQKCEVRLKMQQTMLIPEPKKSNPQHSSECPEGQTTTITVDDVVYCPYCLHKDSITRFYTKTKHGVSEKLFKCPECEQGMRKETLTKKMTPEEYAVWMYDTKTWDRVRFGVWKERLKEYGISWRFWDAYKKHKGEMKETESYEDYIERRQKEEHEEEMSIHDEEEY